ncbi:g1128 [Coccomyxa viridis]|uniref:G1128 protein n=1 Tax=Coccomyxa viridis TaxID=1274662 RepID=A0ABP1FL67_9CHLO
MLPGHEVTVARAAAILALTKAKAVHASKLLAFIILRYGINTARKLAAILAIISRRVLLRLQPAYKRLQRPTDLQQQVRALLTRWTAALSLAFNGQTLRLAAKYAVTVSVQRSCAAPGTTDNDMGLYIRLLGGLLWIQLGARKPQLHTLPYLKSWWPGATPSAAQVDAPATEELQLSPVPQVEKERPQRAPVLTSSTESFRSGLTGYAQLQAPKSSSPQKATRAVSEPYGRTARRMRLETTDVSPQDADCVDRAYAKITAQPSAPAAIQDSAVQRSASVEGAARILAPSVRVISPRESGPVMSGMKKVARSRGTRLAASLDTGAVLRDLLQTVAPVTPTGSSSGSSGTSAKGGLRGSVTSLPPGAARAQKENSGAWR